MTLRKYNTFVYFIILLNLVVNVVIAQEHANTLIPSQTISSRPTTASILPSAIERCLTGTDCSSANTTLGLCKGLLKTPDEYIKEGINNGTYKPRDHNLARCMCNQPYYDSLSTCIECFNNATEAEFSVLPLQEYKDQCENVGTTFTQTMPEITSGPSPTLRLGIFIILVILFLGLLGFSIFKYYKKKKAKTSHKVLVEDGNFSTDNSKYPPPPSPTAHFRYQYEPPTDTPYYPPPPGGRGEQYPLPGGEGEQYPPPPPEYPPPPEEHYGGQDGQGGQGGRIGQGGQSDSYYNSNF